MNFFRDILNESEKSRKTKIGTIVVALLVSGTVLAACGQGGRQLGGNLASRTITATNAGTGLAGSELVNGNSPTKHMDDLGKTIDQIETPEKAPPKPKVIASSGGSSGSRFNPSMCKSIAEGGTGFFAFYGTLATGQLGNLGKYCDSLNNQPQQSTAQSSQEENGGCVWKGRNYGPGESIYHSSGPIMSSDLSVYGDSFDSLTGKSGPWQQCQCSSSSGKWGCV